MTLFEYSEIVLPIYRAEYKYRGDKSVAGKITRALAHHAFYGFEEFGKRVASKRAQAEFKRRKFSGRLSNRRGHEQTDFDPNGKTRGDFFLEHVFTGTMLIHAVEKLIQRRRFSAKTLAALIRKEFCVAWILKDENRKLNKQHKTDRGRSLAEAKEIYSCLGIRLVP